MTVDLKRTIKIARAPLGVVSAPAFGRTVVTAPRGFVPHVTEVPLEACDGCDHPIADHDAIARRYCRATMSNALERRCICKMRSL
jgi:hypothetical protein